MQRTLKTFIIGVLLSVHHLGAQTCLPQIAPPTIDGLVATDPFHLVSGSVPNSDPGWATAPYKEFAVVGGGSAGTLKAAIFAGTVLAGGAPSDLFIGVHVEEADEFSSQDVTTLYFDTDNDGKPDFALSYNVGPSTPITNTTTPHTAASLHVGSANLYVFKSGAWQASSLPGSLQSLTSYNFTDSGTSNGIWELEIKIHLPDLALDGVPAASTTGFQFGAKLYVLNSTSVTGSTPFDWPSGLTTDLNPNDSGPGAGSGGDPAVLDKRTVNPSNNGCSGDVQLQANGLSSNINGGSNDQFYRPKPGDFDGSGNLKMQLQTRLIANTIYVNTGDVGDTSATGGTNTGNAHFFLLPWGVGQLAKVDAGIAPIGFQQFGTPIPASVSWPQNNAQWSPVSSTFQSSSHTCLKVQFEGFIQDSDPTNDNPPQINLSYTTMSTHTDSFLIHAPGTFSPGAPKEDYVMKAHWSNLAKGQARDPGHHESWLQRLWDWLLSLFGHHREYWQTSFVNSAALGLKPMGNGYYGLKLAPGEEVTAEIELSGAKMPVPSQPVHVSPQAGGQVLAPADGQPPVVVPIIPGGMVTIVASGQIGILQQYQAAASMLNNANGFPQPRLDSGKFLLSSKAFTPWQLAGALIGSFHADFSDSFFIGTESTFFAAPTASKLYLAVNDVAGGYSGNTGPGFDLNVIASPPTILPTRLSWPANAQLGLPGVPQPAANLPIVAVDVMRVDPATKALLPIGYVGYATYATHEGNTGVTGGKLP